MQIHPSHQPEARRALRTVALGVLVLLLVNQLLMVLARMATGAVFAGWEYFIAPFVGAVFWPLLTNVLLIPQRRGTPG